MIDCIVSGAIESVIVTVIIIVELRVSDVNLELGGVLTELLL